ncbi:hypothetical protein ACS0PU_004726 [Formica fusca]
MPPQRNPNRYSPVRSRDAAAGQSAGLAPPVARRNRGTTSTYGRTEQQSAASSAPVHSLVMCRSRGYNPAYK